MLMNGYRLLLGSIAAGSLLVSGAVIAQNADSPEPEASATNETATTELPEKVADLVNAMSGVQRIEQIEKGLFAVYMRTEVIGSRIRRDVKLEVAEDGEVVDWGHTPFYTRTYTRRELRETGEMDVAKALEKLDPAIQSRGGG